MAEVFFFLAAITDDDQVVMRMFVEREGARLAMEQAIRPKPEPIYHSPSKDPKWRNNYKLVRDR